MNSKIVILFTVSLLIFGSCTGKKSNSDMIRREKASELKSESSSPQNSAMISSTITNKDGTILKQTFNNLDRTCILEQNNEIIKLSELRTASGIKYSNEHYVYTNWHGETKLFKDGQVIFSSTK